MTALSRVADVGLGLFLEVLPFFALGVVLAGALHAWEDRLRLQTRLGESTGAIFLGAILGCVVPVCSCGVVPIALGLLAGGVAVGPVFAFLAAAPMVNPASFVLTAGVLGTELAAGRVAGAVLLGVGLGLIGRKIGRAGLRGAAVSPCGCSTQPTSSASGDGNVARPPRLSRALYRAGETFVSLLGWVVFGVLLGALLTTFLEPDVVTRQLGGAISVPLAALAGVPLYICSCAEVPVALSLERKGLEPAAVLAFLLAGPGVSVFTLALLAGFLRLRVLLAYVLVFLTGSTALGLLWKGVLS